MNLSSSHPNADVRMRGFRSRASVEEVWAWIHQLPTLNRTETVDLREASGRVLAGPVVSQVAVPQFRRAMMDGYAVSAESTSGADLYQPIRLRVIGESLPGRPFDGRLSAGTAVRIMTGAPLPDSADSVVPVEAARPTGPAIDVTIETTPGKHVGAIGDDVASDSQVLAAGRRLRPQDIGLLSSIGISQLCVVARPTVQIIVTGSEVLPAGDRPRDFLISDANGPMLESLARRDGVDRCRITYVPDDPQQLTASFAVPDDVILVSGGSSVGSEDHAPRLLDQLGELAFHGIAMRPSSPTGLGHLGKTLVFLLPGNPVSCLAAYDFFAGRAIRHLGGDGRLWTYSRRTLPTERKMVSPLGRTDYARVRIVEQHIRPVAISGASVLSSTTCADGFVIVPEQCEGYAAGEHVEVFCYD